MSREETEQQIALFDWAAYKRGQYPELELMYHIPNEGKRSKYQGATLKAMGLLPGMPDVCLPVSRGGFAALYIEMKSRTGTPSAEQENVMRLLRHHGNCVYFCRSWSAASKLIEGYLKGEIERNE